MDAATGQPDDYDQYVNINSNKSPGIGSQAHHMNAWFGKKGLHIAHLNIHFLYPKLDEIKFLTNNQNIDIFCLCETFLNQQFSDNELHITDYNMFRKDRQSHGGGLMVYTKSNLACIHRDDLETEDTEILWLEVKNNRQKPFLLCYCYRPPSATSAWIESFEKSMEHANLEAKEIIVIGDFNINVINDTNSTRNWLLTTDSLNMTQLVKKPTRVTATSETLIDHAYSNTIDNIIEVTVPVLGVSDHYPVCITRKLSKAFDTGPVHKFINYRDTKTFDEEQFLNDLNNQPWSVIDIFDDANDALDYFSDVFNSVLSTHAPKKQKRVKRQKQPKWINDEILTAMKIRNKFKETKNKTQYALWRNKVKLLIRNAKARLYSDSINTSSNPKDLWQTLHEMTGKSAHACTDFINDEDGSPILDPTVCANTFNSFFTSIHANFRTENNINSHNEHPDITSIKNQVKMKLEKTSDFSIPLATESFILKQLQSLKTDKATGLDGLSAKYLKLSAQVIAKPLTAILNQSIQSSSYPNALKKAKVTPIFKKGSKADINNYRPISVLPIINSIFERHISNCLVDYLESNSLLYNHQSGFRRLHSCQTALTKIVDNWLNAINNSETVGTVFLDLTKAFDLVNHKLLIQKLAAYKFSSSTQSWFQSYLTNRSQQVNISGKLSDPQHIAAGVPQGSVLGPLLFLIYINDLPLSIQTCILDLFADDATLSCSDPSILNLTNCLNEDLKNFQDWCIRNDMLVNVPKTKAMFIASRNAANRILENNQDLKLSDETIHITTNEKLLGVHIDNTLSWTAQVESTIKKCSSLLHLLNRIKCYLPVPTRKLFFNSYILPHMDYCCTVWGNINCRLTDSMVKFQKRAARIILDKSIETPSADMFAELNWMTFPDRVKFQKSVLMFKIFNNLTPSYLQDHFTLTSDVHQRPLRSTTENLLYVPKPNIELFRKSLSYSESKIWNAIPDHVKQSTSIIQFKKEYLRWTYQNIC